MEIDKNDWAGYQPRARDGSDVDSSQGNADSEDDPYLEQAERITKSLQRTPAFKYSGQFADPERRAEFVRELAMGLRGDRASQKRPRPQEDEKPFSSNDFWNSDEPGKIIPKKL